MWDRHSRHKSKALSPHMWNNKIFSNRQTSRIQVRQPNHQFVLCKTATAAVKKNNKKIKSFLSTKTCNKTTCKSQMGRNQGSSSPKVWQTYICLPMHKNISSDTTQSHSLPFSTVFYVHSILKSSCKLTDWTLVWLPSADPTFCEPETSFENVHKAFNMFYVFFFQILVTKK